MIRLVNSIRGGSLDWRQNISVVHAAIRAYYEQGGSAVEAGQYHNDTFCLTKCPESGRSADLTH